MQQSKSIKKSERLFGFSHALLTMEMYTKHWLYVSKFFQIVTLFDKSGNVVGPTVWIKNMVEICLFSPFFKKYDTHCELVKWRSLKPLRLRSWPYKRTRRHPQLGRGRSWGILGTAAGTGLLPYLRVSHLSPMSPLEWGRHPLRKVRWHRCPLAGQNDPCLGWWKEELNTKNI